MVSLGHQTWKTLPLWEHQQRAVQTISDYIEAESDGSALIRMPIHKHQVDFFSERVEVGFPARKGRLSGCSVRPHLRRSAVRENRRI
jgi:hypothetical protein